MSSLAQRLLALGLVKPERAEDVARAPASLPALCDDGWLVGGLSVALDVRPDEALGPLLQAMAGSAPRLRVIDVRDRDGVALTVRRPAAEEDETWRVDDVPALVEALAAAFEDDPETGRVEVLGEWNDALQLWVLARKSRNALIRVGLLAAS